MRSVLRPDPVVRALQGAFCRDAAPGQLLRIAAERMHAAGPPYASVRMFLRAGEGMTFAAGAGPEPEAARGPDLAVPIARRDEVLGRIEVAGNAPGRFDESETGAVREIADALAVLL